LAAFADERISAGTDVRMSLQARFAFAEQDGPMATPVKGQLLKWIGNKQRFAAEIAGFFPKRFGTYYEPFLGSGAVLATIAPGAGLATDVFAPLVEIWQALHANPDLLKSWYLLRWRRMAEGDKAAVYEQIKGEYNSMPNGADLLFLCRTCYGGVVRFRKKDGYMSTPCGPHTPVSPASFDKRVDEWHRRTRRTRFALMDYREALAMAVRGDLIYCDPPYSHSQGILYRAQSFSLPELLQAISDCKSRGVYVALSIDGTKKSGDLICDLPIPHDLFEREAFVNCGRSMLKRFQMNGKTLEQEVVADRLLLTY
jgi:DNA adenine methylase